ncbi:MAG: alpha-mannosidase, partial [Lentisphaeria bacterium]|nr:alpha-mannosidase [Lentisphaeria bacterium]
TKLHWLGGKAVCQAVSIDDWEGCLAKDVEPGAAASPGPWGPVSVGQRWSKDGTLHLRKTVSIPPGFPSGGTSLVIRFDDLSEGSGCGGRSMGEALVSIDGKVCGAIDYQHHSIPVPSEAVEAGTCLVEMEVWLVANRMTPGGQTGDTIFCSAQLVERNQAVWAYNLHSQLIFGYIRSLPEAEAELAEALRVALRRSVYSIAFEAEGDAFNASVLQADARLHEELANLPTHSRGRIFLTGHTHLDTAWLWPYSETVRKAARSFTNALNLMDDCDEFSFACSQPQLYQFVRDSQPEIYERVKVRVREGRFEPLGPMWIESDVNIPSGESLIRQLLYGHRFYTREFGTYTPVAWLPDAFGFSPSLPQILSRAGIKYFMTCKMYYYAEEPFPYRLFWWEGIDGSKVLAHTPYLGSDQLYNVNPSPQVYRLAWNEFSQKQDYDAMLAPFGWGDGGGGPTPEQVERCRFMRDISSLPESRFARVADFFQDAEQNAVDLPTWFGEVPVSMHRGTLTSQAWLKKANRQVEQLYRQAEIYSSFCSALGHEPDISRLDAGWELMLLNQFHDVLPGTSVPAVFEETRGHYEEIWEIGNALLGESLSTLITHHGLDAAAEGMCVFNACSWQRSQLLELARPSGWAYQSFATDDNPCIPTQVVTDDDGNEKYLVELDDLPPLGHRYYRATNESVELPPNDIVVRQDRMENRFVRIEFTTSGLILQITDKLSAKQFVESGKSANRFQLFFDKMALGEAWNIDPEFERMVEDIPDPESIEVREAGPLRGRLRVTRRFHDSCIVQDIILNRNSPIIDFRTWVDWRERGRMLKVCFPTNIRAQHATCEVAYGAYERPTHRRTPFEQHQYEEAMHRFVDLSEGDRGLSILNDCKYGGDITGGTLRLTLLRGPGDPDPESDLGEHEFTYSIYCHTGDWRSARVVHRAAELNCPLLMRWVGGKDEQSTGHTASATGAVTVQSESVIIEVLKKSEDGAALVLRAYESHGNTSRAVFEFGFEIVEVTECDLLERPEQGVTVTDNRIECEFTPYEIKTFIVQR